MSTQRIKITSALVDSLATALKTEAAYGRGHISQEGYDKANRQVNEVYNSSALAVLFDHATAQFSSATASELEAASKNKDALRLLLMNSARELY